jgi:hypothetical protein
MMNKGSVMTQDEFLDRYHTFSTDSLDGARTEASRVNAIGIEGSRAVVVQLGSLGYCLMLEQAAQFFCGADAKAGG